MRHSTGARRGALCLPAGLGLCCPLPVRAAVPVCSPFLHRQDQPPGAACTGVVHPLWVRPKPSQTNWLLWAPVLQHNSAASPLEGTSTSIILARFGSALRFQYNAPLAFVAHIHKQCTPLQCRAQQRAAEEELEAPFAQERPAPVMSALVAPTIAIGVQHHHWLQRARDVQQSILPTCHAS